MNTNELTVQWKNYRGFKDTGEIEIKPITILLGTNNSGKTSFIRPLLMLKQTIEARAQNDPLLFKGPLTDCGAYEDAVRDHDLSQNIGFTITFHKHQGRPSNLDPKRLLAPGQLDVEFRWNSDFDEVELQRYSIFDPFGEHLLTRRLLKTGKYSLPNSKVFDFNAVKNEKDATGFGKALLSNVRNDLPMNFFFTDFPFSNTVRSTKNPGKGRATVPDSIRRYFAAVEHIHRSVFDLFHSIRFIGPLRDHPQRVYDISGHFPEFVGSRGEFAPEIIHRLFRNENILEIENWLSFFDLPVKVEIETFGSSAFSLSFLKKGASSKRNYADTGFGLSQLFPIIVQACLSAGNDELLICEQPEIHLNPRIQARLADLFVDLAVKKGRILVETHSEHLVLRLRRLIAEGKIPSSDVAIYFVEKDANGYSTIRSVALETNAHIDPANWPKGFFDEPLRDAIALAVAQQSMKKEK